MAKLRFETSSIVQFYRRVSENAAKETEPDAKVDPDAWRRWAFNKLVGNAAKYAARPGRWRPPEIEDRVQIAVTSLHRQLKRNIDPLRGIASAWAYAERAVEHALVVEGEKGMFGTARNKRVAFRALVQSGMTEEEAGEASQLAGIMRMNRPVDIAGRVGDDGKEAPIDEALSAASAELSRPDEVEDALLLGYETGLVREVLVEIAADETIASLIRDIARIVYIEGEVDSARQFIASFKQPEEQGLLGFAGMTLKMVRCVNHAQYTAAHATLVQIASARINAKRRIA